MITIHRTADMYALEFKRDGEHVGYIHVYKDQEPYISFSKPSSRVTQGEVEKLMRELLAFEQLIRFTVLKQDEGWELVRPERDS